MTDKPAGNRLSRDRFLPNRLCHESRPAEREPALLKRWEEMELCGKLREQSRGKPKYVLHDGPPYGNSNLHISHTLNGPQGIVARSRRMAGSDSDYVPGWDPHGYRSNGKSKRIPRRGREQGRRSHQRVPRRMPGLRRKWIGIQARRIQAPRASPVIGRTLPSRGCRSRGDHRQGTVEVCGMRPALSRL